LQPGFRQVRAGLRHAFDFFFVENLVANLLHQSGRVEIDAAGSLVRALGAYFKPASVALTVASRYALPGYGDRRVRVRGPGWPDHSVTLPL